MRDRVLKGLETYAVPILTAGIGGIVALIGALLKLYSDLKAQRQGRQEKANESDSELKRQGLLSADEQIKLLYRRQEQQDAAMLALQTKNEAQLLELADCRSSLHICEWKLQNVTQERDRLQVQLNELTRPRVANGLGTGG